MVAPKHGRDDGGEAGSATETARVIDGAAERSLCFQLDVRILPVLAVMCMSVAGQDGRA